MAKPKHTTKHRKASLHERVAVTRVRAAEQRIEQEAEAMRQASRRAARAVAMAEKARSEQQKGGEAKRGKYKVDRDKVREAFKQWRDSGKLKHRSEACRRLAKEFEKQASNGKLSVETVRILHE